MTRVKIRKPRILWTTRCSILQGSCSEYFISALLIFRVFKEGGNLFAKIRFHCILQFRERKKIPIAFASFRKINLSEKMQNFPKKFAKYVIIFSIYFAFVRESFLSLENVLVFQ